MMQNPQETPPSPEWFCLQTQPKHEHIAAAHVRQMEDICVFLPRIRFKRATRRGVAWTNEALFPGYLFSRFDWRTQLRAIQHARGVSGIVHFGDRWPTIADETIAELRSALDPEELCVLDPPLACGDVVLIADGSLRGMLAVVAKLQSGRDRVAVLMDFLGRQTMVEVPASAIVRDGESRAGVV